jgi:adenosylcobyric acid synthase
MRARAIMILGNSPHVGKLLLTAALCRIFALQALSGCSFKSQNMSLNSADIEGLEIGRTQVCRQKPPELRPRSIRIPSSSSRSASHLHRSSCAARFGEE